MTHGLARKKGIETSEKARIYKAFLHFRAAPKPWVAGSNLAKQVRYENADGVRSSVQNPPILTIFFSVLSRDTVSVWYSIKKASGASKKYQNKIRVTADFRFCGHPFFVFTGVIFEPL